MRAAIRIALLAATALIPSAAFAQAPSDDEAVAGMEDIVVTARKTEETLSEAPVTVSAVSDAKIAALGLNNIDDISKQATGISFSQAFGRTSDRPVIRGQSNVLANVQFGVETGAAYFVDGIYYQGDIQSFDPDSLQRVEVIKGPQSALYGRNTYAGAINFVTKDPTETLSTSGRASIAEYGEYQAMGSVSGQLVPGLIGFRFGGRHYEYGGQYTNQLTGKKVGQEKTASGYALLTITPGSDLKLRLRGQYTKDEDGPLALFLQGAAANNCLPGFRSAAYRQGSAAVPATLGTSTNANQYFCGTIQPQPNGIRLNTDPVATSFGVRDGTAFDGIETEQWVGSAILDWDIGGSGWVVSSLTGYRDYDRKFGADSDHSDSFFFLGPVLPASVEPAFANTTRTSGWDLSQELRVATPVDRPLRAMVGAYYFKQKNQIVDITFAMPQGDALGTNASNFGTIESKAIFGLIGWDVTDSLSITGELRYSHEEKTSIDRATAASIFCAGVTDPARLAQFGVTAACGAKGVFKGVDPRITIDYTTPGGVLLYAVYAQGRKPGGFNGTGGVSATAITGQNSIAYDVETAKGGEIGAKFDALANTLRVSVAGFYNELSGVQLTRTVPNPTNTTAALTSIVTNAGNATSKGFELEFQAAPGQGFNFTAGVSYVDARFTSGCDADYFTIMSGGLRPNFDTTNPPAAALPFCSIEDKRLPLGSPVIVNGSATWERPLSDAVALWANANFSYEEGKFVQTDNLARTGDTFLLNARVGLRTEHYSIMLFGRNLTDEDSVPLATRWFDYRYGSTGRGLPAGNVSTFNGTPAAVETGAPRAFFTALRKGRTFGVEGTFNF